MVCIVVVSTPVAEDRGYTLISIRYITHYIATLHMVYIANCRECRLRW